MKAPSNVVPTTLEHLVYVCRNMRADEAEQLRAFYAEEDCAPDLIAARLFAKGGPRYTLIIDDLPAVVGGFDLIHGDVWQTWMVGTGAAWKDGWRSVTKATRWMVGALFETGAVKLETEAVGTRTEAHEWYARAMNMTPEGIKRRHGLRGEDIHSFGVLREDF